jgi:hypothetical protein
VPGRIITGRAADCSVTFTKPGRYFLFASYSGANVFDDLWEPSQGELTIDVVDTASTTTSVSAAHGTVVVGQSDTFTATVDVATPGVGPGGSVMFTRGGETLCDRAIVSSTAPYTATCTAAFAAPAQFAVQAEYSGDPLTLASSGDVTETVNPAVSSIALSASTRTPAVGQPVTYTATVSVNAPGASMPTGTVSFTGAAPCAGVHLSAGAPFVATCAATYAAIGEQHVDVTYSGDSTTTSSSSGTTVSVGKAATSTSVTVSPAAPVVGQPVTYTATVSVVPPGAAVPTGTVGFSGAQSCSAVPLSSTAPYHATCTIAYAATGSPSVTAAYAGDDTTATSSDISAITVSKAPTALSVVASPSATNFGQAVGLTATVSAAAPATAGPTPIGTVTFTLDGATYGPAVALTGGQATTMPLTSLAPGRHTLAATYSGSAAYLGSSGSTTETVTCTQTISTSQSGKTQITGSGCVLGATITGPVTVSSGATLALVGATVTGTVTVTGGGAVLICGSTLQGALTITNPTGPVTIGGPACAPNKISAPITVNGASAAVTLARSSVSAPVKLSGNHAGVTVTGNTITAPLTVSGNSGPVVVNANAVTAPVTVSTNNSPPVLSIATNTITGSLSCLGNTPPPTDSDGVNHVSGTVLGQCVGLI